MQHKHLEALLDREKCYRVISPTYLLMLLLFLGMSIENG